MTGSLDHLRKQLLRYMQQQQRVRVYCTTVWGTEQFREGYVYCPLNVPLAQILDGTVPMPQFPMVYFQHRSSTWGKTAARTPIKLETITHITSSRKTRSGEYPVLYRVAPVALDEEGKLDMEETLRTLLGVPAGV